MVSAPVRKNKSWKHKHKLMPGSLYLNRVDNPDYYGEIYKFIGYRENDGFPRYLFQTIMLKIPLLDNELSESGYLILSNDDLDALNLLMIHE